MPRGGGEDPRADIYLRAVNAIVKGETGLDAEVAEEIEHDMRTFAKLLSQRLEKITGVERAAIKKSIEIIQAAAEDLDQRIIHRIGSVRQVSFHETFSIMARAQRDVALAAGIPLNDLGAIAIPRLADAHAFALVAEAYDFRTLARSHVVAAGKEAIAIMRVGILQGTRPDALARALRPYVLGTADIPASVADLRKVPAEYRGAAKQLSYNAKRLAYSETHAARMLAQAVRMRDDPFVLGGRWNTAPNRGKVRLPDICDVLRDADFFGVGPGVYPAGRIPAPPHPWDRCNVTVVPVKVAAGQDWREAKPTADSYELMLNPRDADLPHLAQMTPAAAARVRRDLETLLAA